MIISSTTAQKIIATLPDKVKKFQRELQDLTEKYEIALILNDQESISKLDIKAVKLDHDLTVANFRTSIAFIFALDMNPNYKLN
jgi:thiamine monophosphate synthase